MGRGVGALSAERAPVIFHAAVLPACTAQLPAFIAAASARRIRREPGLKRPQPPLPATAGWPRHCSGAAGVCWRAAPGWARGPPMWSACRRRRCAGCPWVSGRLGSVCDWEEEQCSGATGMLHMGRGWWAAGAPAPFLFPRSRGDFFLWLSPFNLEVVSLVQGWALSPHSGCCAPSRRAASSAA